MPEAPSIDRGALEAAYASALSQAGGVEASGADIKAKFKELWPQVKQGLALLQQLSGLVPGVGSVVGVVIGIVLAAGDAADKAIT